MRYRKRPRGIGTFWWSVGLSRLSNESSNGSKLKSGLWDLSTYNVHTCTHVRPKLTLFFAITGFWMFKYTEWPKGKCTDVNRKSRILYILVVSSENQLFSLFLYDERVEGRFSNKMHRITPKLPCLVCSQSTSGAIHIVSEGRNFGLDFDINMQWPQKDIDGWPHVRVNNVYCISCCFFSFCSTILLEWSQNFDVANAEITFTYTAYIHWRTKMSSALPYKQKFPSTKSTWSKYIYTITYGIFWRVNIFCCFALPPMGSFSINVT